MAYLLIYTSDQVLSYGLSLVGFDSIRQSRQKKATNIEDFKAHYGVHPFVIASIWEQLQKTPVANARIYPTPRWVTNGMVTLKNFLHTFHFLKRYQTESERKGVTGHCKTTLRVWCWFFVEKIRALEVIKVRRAVLLWSVAVFCRRHCCSSAYTSFFFVLLLFSTDCLADRP